MVGTLANRAQLEKAREILNRMAAEVLTKGYFGDIIIQLKVVNGTIQHIEESTSRSHRQQF